MASRSNCAMLRPIGHAAAIEVMPTASNMAPDTMATSATSKRTRQVKIQGKEARRGSRSGQTTSRAIGGVRTT